MITIKASETRPDLNDLEANDWFAVDGERNTVYGITSITSQMVHTVRIRQEEFHRPEIKLVSWKRKDAQFPVTRCKIDRMDLSMVHNGEARPPEPAPKKKEPPKPAPPKTSAERLCLNNMNPEERINMMMEWYIECCEEKDGERTSMTALRESFVNWATQRTAYDGYLTRQQWFQDLKHICDLKSVVVNWVTMKEGVKLIK